MNCIKPKTISLTVAKASEEFRLHLKPGAGVLGLDAQQVSEQVRTACQGMKIDEFQIGPESYEVNLKLIASDRVDAEDLYNLSTAGSEGRLIPSPRAC